MGFFIYGHEFQDGKSVVVLQGMKSVDLKVKKVEGCLKSSLMNQHGWFLQLMAHDSQQVVNSGVDEDITVIDEFADMFAEPMRLAPKKCFDHRIPLKENTGLITIRTYRYPHYQKPKIKT